MIFLSMLALGALIGFVGAGGAGVTITLLNVGFGVPIHEALAVAEFCAEFGVPFLTLRATYESSKAAGVSREAKKVVASNQSFARSLGAFFGATMKKPSAAIDVYKIKQEELQAADKLADALSRVVSTLRIEEEDAASS